MRSFLSLKVNLYLTADETWCSFELNSFESWLDGTRTFASPQANTKSQKEIISGIFHFNQHWCHPDRCWKQHIRGQSDFSCRKFFQFFMMKRRQSRKWLLFLMLLITNFISTNCLTSWEWVGHEFPQRAQTHSDVRLIATVLWGRQNEVLLMIFVNWMIAKQKMWSEFTYFCWSFLYFMYICYAVINVKITSNLFWESDNLVIMGRQIWRHLLVTCY